MVCSPGYIGGWRYTLRVGVTSLPIVESFDVGEHARPGFRAGAILATTDALFCQYPEEALGRGFVVAVADTGAHAILVSSAPYAAEITALFLKGSERATSAPGFPKPFGCSRTRIDHTNAGLYTTDGCSTVADTAQSCPSFQTLQEPLGCHNPIRQSPNRQQIIIPGHEIFRHSARRGRCDSARRRCTQKTACPLASPPSTRTSTLQPRWSRTSCAAEDPRAKRHRHAQTH